MTKLYFTPVDNGDGNSSVSFFACDNLIKVLAEADPEGYTGGDGLQSDWMEFPEGFDVSDIIGIKIETAESLSEKYPDLDFNLPLATEEEATALVVDDATLQAGTGQADQEPPVQAVQEQNQMPNPQT